jgi:hypothetical protein
VIICLNLSTRCCTLSQVRIIVLTRGVSDSSAVTAGQRQSRGKKRLRRVTQAQTPVGDTSSEDETSRRGFEA